MSLSNMLSQEGIDAGLAEAKAAVERGRKALEEQRIRRGGLGVTPEQLQQYIDKLTPRDRAWINSLVSSNLADVQKNPVATKGVRKQRTMV
jgi:hypothetical protein